MDNLVHSFKLAKAVETSDPLITGGKWIYLSQPWFSLVHGFLVELETRSAWIGSSANIDATIQRVLEIESQSGVLPVANLSTVIVRRTSDLNLVSGVVTAIIWHGILGGSGYWLVATPTRLTIPAGGDGMYLLVAGVSWGSVTASTAFRKLAIRKNGSTVVAAVRSPNSSGTVLEQSVVIVVYLVAGDYVEATVELAGPTAPIIRVVEQSPIFTLTKLST